MTDDEIERLYERVSQVPLLVGADYETVSLSPESSIPVVPASMISERDGTISRQQEQIGGLICRVDQLERELSAKSDRVAELEHVVEVLTTERLVLLNENGDLARRLGEGDDSFAGRSEAELVSRAIPGRALRYGF